MALTPARLGVYEVTALLGAGGMGEVAGAVARRPIGVVLHADRRAEARGRGSTCVARWHAHRGVFRNASLIVVQNWREEWKRLVPLK